MIRILTKVNIKIHPSHVDRKTKVCAVAKVNPRNLLKLAPQVREWARHQEMCLGNIGHAGTWLEINHILVDAIDLADLAEADKPDYPGGPRRTRTQKAKALIARCGAQV